MKLDIKNAVLKSILIWILLSFFTNAEPEEVVVKFSEKQEQSIKKINSSFLGFHIRYRQGKNGEAIVAYAMPPKIDKLEKPLEKELQGVVVVIDSKGNILDVKPIKSKL